MTFINDDTWKWLKTAPLPVVLSMCLTSSGILATWLYAVDKEQSEQRAAVAVAAEQAKTAAEIAKGMDAKVDRLLVIVLEMQAEKKAEKAEGAKKGGK
jgi:hypothetical protein